jgi:SAM-dependent methyltransferase
METVREHDRLYLHEQRYDRPKEAFKFMAQRAVARYGVPGTGTTVCDIGCAAGELAYYLTKIWPQAEIVGYDVRPELVERAREMVPGARFAVGSVLEAGMLPESSADVLFMAGVLSIFDDFRPSIDNILSWLKPGGTAVVFGVFNPSPVDVIIRSRGADAPLDSAWETGWNVFSTASVGSFLQQHPLRPTFDFERFSIPIDLAPNPADPLRSWTVPMADGERMIVNGLCLLHHFMTLEITRPKN